MLGQGAESCPWALEFIASNLTVNFAHFGLTTGFVNGRSGLVLDYYWGGRSDFSYVFIFIFILVLLLVLFYFIFSRQSFCL